MKDLSTTEDVKDGESTLGVIVRGHTPLSCGHSVELGFFDDGSLRDAEHPRDYRFAGSSIKIDSIGKLKELLDARFLTPEGILPYELTWLDSSRFGGVQAIYYLVQMVKV